MPKARAGEQVKRCLKMSGLEAEFSRWLAMAEAGDAEAQYQIASSYFTGVEIKKDMKAAAHWYEKAAQQGHVEAQYDLGPICRRQQDSSAATR